MSKTSSILKIIEIILTWLYEKFSLKSQRIKKAEKLKDQAMAEKDGDKLVAALDRLEQEKQ